MLKSLHSSPSKTKTHCLCVLAGLGIGIGTLLAANSASAASIIKNPGDHPDYSVELEPHLALFWGYHGFGGWGGYGFDSSGFGYGPGVRVNIPLMKNGPIDKINNNMAIGFGADFGFFSEHYGYGNFNCNRFSCAPGWGGYDWSAHEFWFPVDLQWNFFLTDVISVFGEPGLSFVHWSYSFDNCNSAFYPGFSKFCGDSGLALYFVFWAGARFMFSDTVGAVVRLGYPYLSGGITFLL